MMDNWFTLICAYFHYDQFSNAWFSFLHQNLPIVKMPKKIRKLASLAIYVCEISDAVNKEHFLWLVSWEIIYFSTCFFWAGFLFLWNALLSCLASALQLVKYN